jgi:hypothetical protein
LSYKYPVYVVIKENSEIFFHSRLTRMLQLVTFSKLSNDRNDVDTTGTGSMRVVASRVAIWLGDGSAEVDQSVGLLGRQI